MFIFNLFYMLRLDIYVVHLPWLEDKNDIKQINCKDIPNAKKYTHNEFKIFANAFTKD